MKQSHPKGYSGAQIGLHWAIAGLVAFQILGHDGIEAVWRATRTGAEAGEGDMKLATLHVWSGATIFALMLWRLALRLRRGAPTLPEGEPKPFRFLAHATHVLFYALLIGMPVSGSVAWFFGVEAAANAHAMAKNVLLALIGLHLVGVLAQFFVFKTDVPSRMMIADDSDRAR